MVQDRSLRYIAKKMACLVLYQPQESETLGYQDRTVVR